jgi:hypothetical protein
MDSTTLTISLPTNLVRKVERIAHERDISLDALLVEMLARLVYGNSNEQHAAAKADHLAMLAQGFDVGTGNKPSWSCNDLRKRR